MIHQIDLSSTSDSFGTKSLVFVYADTIGDHEYLSKLYKNHKLELYRVLGELREGFFVFDDTFYSNI